MNTHQIVHRSDGSIDTEFYLKRAHLIRSRRAGAFLHRLRRALVRLASSAVKLYGAAEFVHRRD